MLELIMDIFSISMFIIAALSAVYWYMDSLIIREEKRVEAVRMETEAYWLSQPRYITSMHQVSSACIAAGVDTPLVDSLGIDYSISVWLEGSTVEEALY